MCFVNIIKRFIIKIENLHEVGNQYIIFLMHTYIPQLDARFEGQLTESVQKLMIRRFQESRDRNERLRVGVLMKTRRSRYFSELLRNPLLTNCRQLKSGIFEWKCDVIRVVKTMETNNYTFCHSMSNYYMFTIQSTLYSVNSDEVSKKN